jgi:hypothetical protein
MKAYIYTRSDSRRFVRDVKPKARWNADLHAKEFGVGVGECESVVPVLDEGILLGEIHQPMVERPRKIRRRSSHRKTITGRQDDARYDQIRVAR